MAGIAASTTRSAPASFNAVHLIARLPLRLPPIRLGARAAHQHGALRIREPLRLQKRLHALLVIHDRSRARPVRAPETALETPGIEDARQRIPDVVVGIGLLRECAGAAHLDDAVFALRKL